jgi:HSP20 family protein
MTYKNFFPIQHNSYDKPDLHNTYYPFFTSDKDIGEFLSPLSPDFCENSFFDFLPSKKNQFPKVDISETKDSYLITAELPGIDEKNVDVTLDEKILSIKGDKKEEIEDEQSEFYSRERSYGIFQRDFEVPETIDENKIHASFSNGLLTVKMPKAPEATKEVKKIPITR